MPKLTNELLNRRSLIDKMPDKGMKLRDNNNVTITHWKGIHVKKDAAVTIKMVLENLASWFCRKVLMWLLLRSTQINMYEKLVMSSEIAKLIVIAM